jgi:hypothetical protein
MTTAKLLFFAGLALLMAAPNAAAQRWGRERTPRDGACFYRDADFEGDYFCVASGEGLRSIPSGMNDRISSMRLFGRVDVTVYRDRNFNGRSLRLTRDVRNLKREGWNDTISSLDVQRPRGGRPDFRRPSEDPDRIVRRAYQDVLEREPDTAGLRQYRSRIIDDGWSEAEVRDALRRSSEYQTVRVRSARETVRRAYLNVLKREPDSGASGYIDKVLRQNWTQADVERELRKSPEYRGRR